MGIPARLVFLLWCLFACTTHAVIVRIFENSCDSAANLIQEENIQQNSCVGLGNPPLPASIPGGGSATLSCSALSAKATSTLNIHLMTQECAGQPLMIKTIEGHACTNIFDKYFVQVMCESDAKVDCITNDWGAWSGCTASCGGGTQIATRSIVMPPANGGADCGLLEKTQQCNTNACPVDCQVSEWSAFGSCSQMCGGGTEQRTRTVTRAAANGGAACPALSEIRPCNTHGCPVDCAVTEWGPFDACSASCGGGLQSRSRTVSTTALNGGSPCPVLTETKTCNTHACATDCSLSEWSAWSPCDKPCGSGSQKRTRIVTVAEANGGTCPGLLEETQVCNSNPCKKDCIQSDWSDFGSCSVSCGGGSQIRTRTVLVEPENGGTACGATTDMQPCGTDACPQDCILGNWTGFSQCSATCGGGRMQRTRSVVTGALNGGLPCGSQIETVDCNTQPCPQHCVMTNWSGWSQCSQTCGSGTQSRSRSVALDAKNDGIACPKNNTQKQHCNVQDCPNDCQVSAYSMWSPCSASCGGGVRVRSRSVVSEASANGKGCPSLTQREICNTDPCGVSCKGDWGHWSECSKSCGSGTTTRVRDYNGTNPEGCEQSQTTECNTHSCPIDCVMNAWTSWSACSVSCGGGLSTRARSVQSYPREGGRACSTVFSEEKSCNTQPCMATPQPTQAANASGSSTEEGTIVSTIAPTATVAPTAPATSAPTLPPFKPAPFPPVTTSVVGTWEAQCMHLVSGVNLEFIGLPANATLFSKTCFASSADDHITNRYSVYTSPSCERSSMVYGGAFDKGQITVHTGAEMSWAHRISVTQHEMYHCPASDKEALMMDVLCACGRQWEVGVGRTVERSTCPPDTCNFLLKPHHMWLGVVPAGSYDGFPVVRKDEVWFADVDSGDAMPRWDNSSAWLRAERTSPNGGHCPQHHQCPAPTQEPLPTQASTKAPAVTTAPTATTAPTNAATTAPTSAATTAPTSAATTAPTTAATTAPTSAATTAPTSQGTSAPTRPPQLTSRPQSTSEATKAPDTSEPAPARNNTGTAAPTVHCPTVCEAQEPAHHVSACGCNRDDGSIPNIRWGMIPPNMVPAKVIGEAHAESCACLHLQNCPCRTHSQKKQEIPCTCHTENHCPCADKSVEVQVATADATCCPVEAECHPALHMCSHATSPAHIVKVASCCPQDSECDASTPRCEYAQSEAKELQSNCCLDCTDKPKCTKSVTKDKRFQMDQ